MKIQISTCVHQQNPRVLEAYLWGISHLDTEGLDVTHSFMLHNPFGYEQALFDKYLPDAQLEVYESEDKAARRGVYTHYWAGNSVQIVASMKNYLIDQAKEEGRAIFFCDSDQVLQPPTLKQLVSQDKDLIGEILWTRWRPQEGEKPNAWDYDDYLFKGNHDVELRTPGVHEVGFCGGLLLISHKALVDGMNYKIIPNLTFWGEDRHLGIRAAVLGYQMYVDTHYPAFHIYRDQDLEKLPEWVTLDS